MSDDSRPSIPLRAVLLRGVPLALLTALACGALAWLLSARQEDRFEAEALVLVRPVGADPALAPGGGDAGEEGQGTATNALLVTSRDVLARAARTREVELTTAELEDAVTAEPLAGTNLVRVAAATRSAESAAAAATGVAEAFVAARRGEARRRARSARRALRRQYAALSPVTQASDAGVALLERVQELETVERLGQQAPRVAETAAAPTEPTSPRPRRDAVLGGLFGLLLGGGLAVLWVAGSHRPRRSDDVERALGTPVLATLHGGLPRRGGVSGLLEGADANALRLLHARLRRAPGDGPVRTLAVTSVRERDVEALAWRLAAVAAAGGERVLVLDTGRGAPGLSQRFGGTPSEDWTPARDGSPEPVARVSLNGGSPEESAFDVIADAGAGGGRLVGLLDAAAEEWELVLVPTPGPAAGGDAIAALTHVDAVVVLAQEGEDEEQRVRALRTQLEAAGASVLGVVLED